MGLMFVIICCLFALCRESGLVRYFFVVIIFANMLLLFNPLGLGMKEILYFIEILIMMKNNIDISETYFHSVDIVDMSLDK